jgi:excisionase family DNA binding protein
MSSDEILTALEATKYLKISTKLLYKLITAGHISAKKVGNGYRIKKSVLVAYMNDDIDPTTGESNE